jgi:sugar/nucleoside kinase (ribokinase family)
MNIVLIGHACIDHNTSEQAHYIGWGSAVLHMAHFFQTNLGTQPLVVAHYGPDLLEHAAGFRLYPEAPSASRTLQYVNTATRRGRRQVCRHTAEAEPVPIDAAVTAALAAADIVMVAPLLPNFSLDYVTELMSQVPEHTLRVLLPQGYLRNVGAGGAVSQREFSEARELLSEFGLVILSEEDCDGWQLRAREWATATRAAVVVTRGAAGATIFSGNELVAVPTMPLALDQVVDSVGCGDVFSAALSYHFREQGNLALAVAAANQAAHAKLTRIPAARRSAVAG